MNVWSLVVYSVVFFSAFVRGETLGINAESTGRLHIIMQNNSTEDIIVAIHHAAIEPVDKNKVKIGEWRNFFPQQLTSPKHPLHVRIRGSSTGKLNYTLNLRGNPKQGAMSACRAYGSLELRRGDEVMQSIGASALAEGIILQFGENYELYMEPIKWRDRNRKTGKEREKNTQTCPSHVH